MRALPSSGRVAQLGDRRGTPQVAGHERLQLGGEGRIGLGVDEGVRHAQADELYGAQVFFFKILSPDRRYVAAFDDEVLLVLDSRLHHFTNYRPEVFRELFVVLGRKGCVSASDEAHLQVVDGQIGRAVPLQQALGQQGLSRVRAPGQQTDHNHSSLLFFVSYPAPAPAPEDGGGAGKFAAKSGMTSLQGGENMINYYSL